MSDVMKAFRQRFRKRQAGQRMTPTGFCSASGRFSVVHQLKMISSDYVQYGWEHRAVS